MKTNKRAAPAAGNVGPDDGARAGRSVARSVRKRKSIVSLIEANPEDRAAAEAAPPAASTSAPVDVGALLGALQGQLEETRKQLLEMMTKRDAKDITVNQVIDAYLAERPDATDPEVMQDRVRCLQGFAAACGTKRISECGPLDLTAYLKSRPGWRSAWTKGKKIEHIRRCFRWAMFVKLIREYPFFGVKGSRAPGGRPMTDDEYRKFLRNTPAPFRRFLMFLRWTGCRPSEASRLRWSDIDWTRRIVTLKEHKTAKKSGVPRVLLLPPVIVKLLRWQERNRDVQRDWKATAKWLYGMLRNGPMSVKEITRAARAVGITDRRLYLARDALGVQYKRVGGWAAKGHTVCTLTKDPPAEVLQEDGPDFVFLNWKRHPWNKRSLACLLARLRRRKVIVKGMRLYGLRHRVATELVRRGVNLKVVASILGHSQISTTMGYVKAVGEDTNLLLSELQKVDNGA